MRTIKFRVWDKHKKYMHKLDALFLDEKMFRVQNYKNEHDVFSFGTEYFSEPMQFTGLLDKNGVEVFEGDVVKSNSHKPTTFKIEFIEGGFCATQSEHNYPLDINHFYPSTGCMIEVIGNIFQHPHLLEANHD